MCDMANARVAFVERGVHSSTKRFFSLSTGVLAPSKSQRSTKQVSLALRPFLPSDLTRSSCCSPVFPLRTKAWVTVAFVDVANSMKASRKFWISLSIS